MNNKLFVGLVVPLSMFVSLVSASVVLSKSYQPTFTTNQTPTIQRHVDLPDTNNKLIGFYTNNGDGIKSLQSRIGDGSGIVAWFSTWSNSLENNKLKSVCASDAIPFITWESWAGKSQPGDKYPLAEIAAGKYDTYITQEMTKVARVCKDHPVLIRFDHEMEADYGANNWYPWQSDPAAYVAAWNRVVTLSRKANQNVRFVWSPNRGNELTASYYPGASYVDYVGLTLNNATPGASGLKSFSEFYGANSVVIESFNKPVIISETGVAEYVRGFKADWITGMYEFMQQSKTIVALISIDNLQTYSDGSVADYRLDSSYDAFVAYKAAVNKYGKKAK